MYPLKAEGIEKAGKNIANVIHLTPILTSTTLDDYINVLFKNEDDKKKTKLYFKCENFQKTGSFKCRGAANAVYKILNNSSFKNINGFITHSSGNHGQALAYSSLKNDKKCIVVVPNNAPKAKIDAIKGYGAEIIFVENTMDARISTCEKISKEKNYHIVDPHDDWDIIEGQGTIAIEMDQQIKNLDCVILSIGGGGLAAGILQWLYERRPYINVFLIEPEGKNINDSIKAGERLWKTTDPLDTIADGVRVRPLGIRCFEVIKHRRHHVVSVTNDDIKNAWKLIFERLKIIIEPTAAMPLAAIIKNPELFKEYKNIGIILCGGNVDFDRI